MFVTDRKTKAKTLLPITYCDAIKMTKKSPDTD